MYHENIEKVLKSVENTDKRFDMSRIELCVYGHARSVLEGRLITERPHEFLSEKFGISQQEAYGVYQSTHWRREDAINYLRKLLREAA